MSALRNKSRHLIHIRIGFLCRLVVVLIVCIVCWALYTLAGNKLLAPITKRRIEQLTGLAVEIRSIDFKSTGFVRINYLVIGGPVIQPYESKILRANKVDVRFSLASILRLKPQIKKITLRDYIVNAQYNTQTMQWNIASLNIRKSSKAERLLPHIQVKSGILKLTKVEHDQVTDIAVIEVDGELKPARVTGRTYSFYFESKHSSADQYYFVRGIWESGSRGKVILNGRIPPTNLPVLGNRWAINDLVLDLSYDPKQISINRLKCALDSRTQLALAGTVTDFAPGAEYDIRIHFKDLLLTSKPTLNALVYTPPILEKLAPGLRKFLAQYNPHGWGDIDVRTEGKFGRLAERTWAGTVTCRDISVLDKKFPYRLDHMTGLLDVTEKSVTLNNLKCKHGTVDLVINGHAEKFNRQWYYDMQITSSNMLLDDDLYKALNTEQKRLWFVFAPTGLARIHYKLARQPDRERKTALVVDLLDAQAIYQHFPYPLKNLTGNVYIEPGTLKLDQVVSQYDGCSITLNGEITETQTERPRYNITIDADDVPIDSTLKTALPAKQREFYESFEVDALTDVQIKVFPNEVGTRLVEYIAKASIKNASLIYEKFPLPLTEVNVEAILTPDLVRLESMTGKSGDSTVAVTGKVWPADEDELMPGYCLSVEAKDLELNDKWLKALPTEASELVAKIRPVGKVNISADISAGVGAADCAPYKVVIECLGTDINLEAFPYPIKNVTGSITLTPENILLQNLTATGAQTAAGPQSTPQITLDGRVVARHAEVVSGRISLHARNIALNDALARALPEYPASIYRAISPTGTVDLDIDEAIFDTDTNDQRWLKFVGAQLAFDRCSFASRQTLTDLNGVLTADLSYKLGHGLWSASADLNADTLRVRNQLLRSLRAPITYDRENTSFISNGFTADCYHGKVIGDLKLKQPTGKLAPYILSLVFDDIDIAGILAAAAKGEQEHSDTHTHGSADGAFTAVGTLGQKASSIGRLNISITDMELARRSLLGKVLTALQFDKPTDFIFSDMTIAAYLKESEIVFEEVYMSGKSTVLAGSGRLDLDSNEIVLDLTASGKKITSNPSFLESLAKGLGSAVVKVEVRGDIEKPDIQTKTLPLFRGPLGILGTRR